jgi:hypothetical protein
MAFLSFKWLFSALLSVMHPFYISVTEINHNAKEKSVEISCKVFAEDLEEILKTTYNRKVDLSNERDQALNDKNIAGYFSHNFNLVLDGKPVKPTYIGFEKEKEAVYCYFEVPNVSSVKKIEMSNSILYDFTDKQINIIHVTVKGNRKSSKLDYPNKQVAFTF